MKDLTDLYICKHIAECVGYKPKVMFGKVICKDEHAEHFTFNPLTDKDLCFDLMVRYRVSPFVGEDYTSVTNYNHNVTLARDACPQRAICLAVIEQQGR